MSMSSNKQQTGQHLDSVLMLLFCSACPRSWAVFLGLENPGSPAWPPWLWAPSTHPSCNSTTLWTREKFVGLYPLCCDLLKSVFSLLSSYLAFSFFFFQNIFLCLSWSAPRNACHSAFITPNPALSLDLIVFLNFI